MTRKSIVRRYAIKFEDFSLQLKARNLAEAQRRAEKAYPGHVLMSIMDLGEDVLREWLYRHPKQKAPNTNEENYLSSGGSALEDHQVERLEKEKR